MNCENCDHSLDEDDKVDESHGLAMYRHVDHLYQCPECGHFDAYRGEPVDDHDAGMDFYVIRRSDGIYSAERPDCPECETPMYATKNRVDSGIVQFKCDPEVSPDCPAPYRTIEVDVEHVHEPGDSWE